MAGIQKASKPEKTIQSVARAIEILKYIADNGNSVGLTAIAEGVDLNFSTAHGLLSTLKQYGLVYQNESAGKYSLGMSLFELGQVVHRSMDVRVISLPYIRMFSGKYGETVHLGVLSEYEVFYIEKVDSFRSIRMISQVGLRNPAYCTGLGKVLLAGLSESEIANYIKTKELKRFTSNTITNGEDLKRQLEIIRKQGYGLDNEEIEAGLRCIAAPVRNHQGRVVAAISISIPANRLQEEQIPAIIEDAMATALDISVRLGYRV